MSASTLGPALELLGATTRFNSNTRFCEQQRVVLGSTGTVGVFPQPGPGNPCTRIFRRSQAIRLGASPGEERRRVGTENLVVIEVPRPPTCGL